MAKAKNTKAKKRYATHVTTPNGERVYISATSQEELDRKVALARMQMGAGVDIANNTSFEEFARIWFKAYKTPPKIRQSTYENLLWHLEHQVIPGFKGLALKDVKPLHVQAFRNSLSEYGRSVQSKCLMMVRGIFLSAEDNGLILKSPVRSTDKPYGQKTKEKVPLTNEQATRLLTALKGTDAYLFCLLALTTGMRRGEILGLMWEDVDFDSGYINVTHNNTIGWGAGTGVTTMLKTDAARRRIPMPLLLRHTLELEKKKSKAPFVLATETGKSYTRTDYDTLWYQISSRTVNDKKPLGSTIRNRKTGERVPVVLDFPATAHQLRHTFITQLFESGMDIKQVQYLAGHSTPEMTLRVYTHYRQQEREKQTETQVQAATEYLGAVTPFPVAPKVVAK